MKTQFERWWEQEGSTSVGSFRELCEIAWNNGAYCATHPSEFGDNPAFTAAMEHVTRLESGFDDSDLDEPLGPACNLDNPDCESCS